MARRTSLRSAAKSIAISSCFSAIVPSLDSTIDSLPWTTRSYDELALDWTEHGPLYAAPSQSCADCQPHCIHPRWVGPAEERCAPHHMPACTAKLFVWGLKRCLEGYCTACAQE